MVKKNLTKNIKRLFLLFEDDRKRYPLTDEISSWIYMRFTTLSDRPTGDYEPVLGDLVYYLISKNLMHLKIYNYANKLLEEANDRRNSPGRTSERINP